MRTSATIVSLFFVSTCTCTMNRVGKSYKTMLIVLTVLCLLSSELANQVKGTCIVTLEPSTFQDEISGDMASGDGSSGIDLTSESFTEGYPLSRCMNGGTFDEENCECVCPLTHTGAVCEDENPCLSESSLCTGVGQYCWPTLNTQGYACHCQAQNGYFMFLGSCSRRPSLSVVLRAMEEYLPVYSNPTSASFRERIAVFERLVLFHLRENPFTRNVISAQGTSIEPGSVVVFMVLEFPADVDPSQDDVRRVLSSTDSLSDGVTTIPIDPQSVIVQDTDRPPVVSCPESIPSVNVESGKADVAVLWSPMPSAVDAIEGVINPATITCKDEAGNVVMSGDRFRVGTTSVTCTASDSVSHQAACQFTVQVNDNEDPTIICPANSESTLSGEARSERVEWSQELPSANDNVDGTITDITCRDEGNAVVTSGGVYAKGVTVVTCTAQDSSGNEGMCKFSVIVEGASGTNAAVIVGCVLGIVLLLVVAAVTVCAVRSKMKLRAQNALPIHSAIEMKLTDLETTDAPEGRVSTVYEEPGLPPWAAPWEIYWNHLAVDDEVLGKGNFGEVRSGTVIVDGKKTKAAIKMLKGHASPSDSADFMEEFRTMSSIGHHQNVVSLLGACQREDTLYVALEYLANGDLQSFLRRAYSKLGCEDAVCADQLVRFALDIAKGMRHLAKSGVIHRDLAARNILLGEGLIAKVSDFGLSRGEDVYVQTSRRRIPVRWLALESLMYQTYTTQSDVWSFGIVLWEIATLGGTPYPGISKSRSLAGRLKEGYRMARPNNCDEEIYALMLRCWDEDPNNRPSFTDLVSILNKMDDNILEHAYLAMDQDLYENVVRLDLDDE